MSYNTSHANYIYLQKTITRRFSKSDDTKSNLQRSIRSLMNRKRMPKSDIKVTD